ncbi:MAG: hypothetical protein HZY75_12915 [Nocardioidaceae bacterium]|nr:MAG: hypothetical protein HZY75_12915 [Nocardioidaceae bacterium]
MGRAVSASSRRSVLALVALAGLLASLLVISSSTATSAAPVAARAGTANVGPMKATAGQWLTFSGKVPTGDKRPVIVQRLWAGKWVSPVRGSSNASGAYSIKVRMMAMPEEYFSVFAPKAGNRKAWRSKTFKIKNVMQEVRLNRSGNSFRANTSPDGAGRVVALQQRVSPGQWKTLETATTRAGGAAAFSHVPATDDGIYRAVARGWKGMGSYISFPLHLDSPDLVWKYVNDPGARGVLNPSRAAPGVPPPSTTGGRPTSSGTWNTASRSSRGPVTPPARPGSTSSPVS